MFSLTYSTPAPIAGTLRLKAPLRSLGIVTDVDGVRWDIHAIYPGYVNACRVGELHPYFGSTATSGWGTNGTSGSNVVSQKWLPYRVEVVP